ncbi:AlwI family type II restriction endonuclease, partial [Alkalimonas sp. MEB108]
MASEKTASSKSWFFPTSPRSPYKLQGELKLLKQLEGKPWGAETQQEFAKLLMESPDFEGKTSRSEAAFSGRDRATRAPRLLGFVHFPRRGQKGAFKFTEIGNIFIQSTPEEQALIFQRQIAKVQFRSPLHNNKGFGDMSIRPLIVMLRLLFELDSLSKHEIALFAITITSETKFNEHVAVIRQFRESLSNLSGLERKSYKKSFSEEWVGKIYEEDILAGRTKLRQGGDDFISKKFRT